MKKGQAALEFLMTYGWVILVFLVILGALAYFGLLGTIEDGDCEYIEEICRDIEPDFYRNGYCYKDDLNCRYSACCYKEKLKKCFTICVVKEK